DRRRPHLGPPDLAEREGGRAARRAVRLARPRPRGRPLQAPAAEGRRVPRVPLRRPPLSRLRQGRAATERRRAGRLPRRRLSDHAPERGAAPGDAPVRALRERRGAARDPLLQGLRLSPLPRPRRPVRLLLPDPGQDRAQAGHDRGRDVRGALRGSRPRHLQREAGDHLLPQDHQARARDAPRARAADAAVPARGARAVLRRHRGRGRADLGPARQLQGGRRGPRVDERVGDLAPPERHPSRADDLQRRAAAAHAAHRHLRYERRLPRLRHARGLVGDRRRDGRRARRRDRLVPLQEVLLTVKQLWAPWRLEYVAAADEQEGCVFCLAEAGDDEDRLVVHRGERAFVLLNKFPYASGHLMVAPKRHVGELAELDDEEALELHLLAVQGLAALAETFGPQGYNLGWNLGRIAGAGIVDHVHVHVVPRWAGDTNFMPVLADVKVLPEALVETRRKLAAAWPR